MTFIKIPTEHLSKFKNSMVYLSFWKDKSIWMMSEEEKDQILTALKNLSKGGKVANYLGLARAGIVELEVSDGGIEIPRNYIEYIGSTNPIVAKQDTRLILH